MIRNRFKFYDTGLLGSRLVLIITRCGIIDNGLAFININFGSIVTILNSICFGLESIGTLFVLFDNG